MENPAVCEECSDTSDWTVWETLTSSRQIWGLAFYFLTDKYCLNHRYDSCMNIEDVGKMWRDNRRMVVVVTVMLWKMDF